MANTTLSQLTNIVGTDVAATDSFLIYDVSANTEKQITSAELKNMVGNGTFTFTTSGATEALVVTSTDTGATAAPDIVFYRNSSSPAANDLLGDVVFRGKNSLSANVEYAMIGSTLMSPTATSEKGNITFSTMYNGTLTERARIRDDGGIGFGGVGAVNVGLYLQKNVTGSTSSYSLYAAPAIQSDVTSAAFIVRTTPTVANSAFTVSALHHYNANQGTIGASATVGAQYGFTAAGTLIGATSNYGFTADASTASSVTTGKTVVGFRSAHPIATGGGASWNFYANGTAPNLFTGDVGIGAASTGSKLHVSGNTYISGAVTLATALPLTSGGTGVTSAPAAAATLYGFTSTATAAGTTTLTNSSSQYQLFTGTTTQTVVLPVASTLTTGWTFHIVNNSTGNLTVNSSGGNLVVTVYPNMTAMVTCILASGTTAASWESGYTDFGAVTGTGSNVLGTSPTIATPTITTPTLTGGTINNTVIGGTTPVAGSFTTVTGSTSILSAGAGGVGYSTGAGGAVTQLTSRTTGVTLNKTAGAITLFTAAGSATAATFTVTNSTVAATDTIIVNQKSGTNLYILAVTAVAAGSFNITFYTTGGTASDAPVINFAVIKSVAA